MAKVHLSPEADRDIADIFDELFAVEGVAAAEKFMEGFNVAVGSLRAAPAGGAYPTELLKAGITLFRETRCEPWRVFYRIVDGDIRVVAVLDSRRSVVQLLPERLARG